LEEIKRGKINPSSAICAANAEISAMYGKKVYKYIAMQVRQVLSHNFGEPSLESMLTYVSLML